MSKRLIPSRWTAASLRSLLIVGLVIPTEIFAQSSPAEGAPAVGPKVEFVNPMANSDMTQGGHDLSTVGMFVSADGVVQAVIILLLIASAVSWTIGVAKWIELRGERQRLAIASRALAQATGLATVGDIGQTPLADMVVNAEDEIAAASRAEGHTPAEGVKDRIAMRLERLEAGVRRRAGRGLVVLAIIGSSTPFIGLFGTVWGIMNSFIGIANSRTTNLAVVAPGIAEALLTTAAGLVAAIPAVVMYNLFSRAITIYGGELADASATVLCLAGREIDVAAQRS